MKMKKMMKTLSVTLIAMLLMVCTMSMASAEVAVFQPAITNDDVAGNDEIVYEQNYEDVVYEEVSASAGSNASSGPAAPPSITPELPPAPQAEAGGNYTDLSGFQDGLGLGSKGITIVDEPIPLSSGVGSLFVEIVSDVNNPQYGEDVTLRSFVVNPEGLALTYQWQIDRGFGWENLLEANASEYTFNYNETVSGCSFRVFVDLLAI